MTIDDVMEILKDERKELSSEEISQCMEFFMEDSEGETKYIPEFVRFYFMAVGSADGTIMDDCHLCNQKYIANISGKPALKREHLPYLYLKEVDYYTMVNSYSESIRNVNKILELEDVPEFCNAAALSQAVNIFMTCGLTKEAESYVDRLCALTLVSDLPDNLLLLLDCNLLQAYAAMGKRKDYELRRKSISLYSEKNIEPGTLSLSKLYILGTEAVLDGWKEPTMEYIREFTLLMENDSFETVLTADYSQVVVPILRWLKGYIPMEKLIRYAIKMIDISDTIQDKLDMYEVLVNDFEVERPKYGFIYDDYLNALRDYYVNSRETHRHEVVGEMMSYAVESQYRKKALTDELTGLGNRAAYEAEMDALKGECAGRETLPDDITVIAMDVNGLKGVNDNYGHAAGDNYIIGAAECMNKSIGNYGRIYRIGGDEFTAIVRSSNFPVDKVIAILRNHLSNWTDSFGNELTISVGAVQSVYMPHKALDELMHAADEQMYKDKSLYYRTTGKDRRQR